MTKTLKISKKDKEHFHQDKKTVVDYPDLMEQWHPEKNTGINPDVISAGSHKKIWWKCPEGKDHEWQSAVSSRTQSRGGTNCPCCAGLKISITNARNTPKE